MPFSHDTRTLRPGDTYVAIRGETYDGHDFISEAIEKGAVRVVAEKEMRTPPGVELIRVRDAESYLVEQARQKVNRVQPQIVAITGSVGKTSTRAAIQAVLAESVDVVASEGNRNTPLGLSTTILNREFASKSILVLEMGARNRGDIRQLATSFRPTVAVVTNVKGVHLETFGSIEEIAQEKSELVRGLAPSGTACLNGEDPRVRAMASLHDGDTLLYGSEEDCQVRPEHITAQLPTPAPFAMQTALAAAAAGRAMGLSWKAINHGLERTKPEPGRLARLPAQNGAVLIDDSYNASPDATLAAIELIRSLQGARRIAFLGDMLELGADEVPQHVRVLNAAAGALDEVHAVGPLMAKAAQRLDPSARDRCTVHETAAEAAESLRRGAIGAPRRHEIYLVKGSQGTRMERISAALLHPDVDPSDVLPRQSDAWKQIV